jgi:hypothetical protein
MAWTGTFHIFHMRAPRICTTKATVLLDNTHRHRFQNAYETTAHSRFLNSVSTSTKYDWVGRHTVANPDPSFVATATQYLYQDAFSSGPTYRKQQYRSMFFTLYTAKKVSPNADSARCNGPGSAQSTVKANFPLVQQGFVLAANVALHTTYLTSPADIFSNHNWKRTVEWTVRAVGFIGLDELGSRYKITTFRIILATILHFLNDILQKPAPGL